MTDNELLLAISEMLDKKLEPMKKDIQNIKSKVKMIENKTENIENCIRKIELTQENEILPRLRTIESCYTSTFDRYKDGVEEHETIKQDISIIKNVVTEHSEKLHKIS
ncbi:MAG: hypothetical protein HFJ08_10950 [Lachnospiraceae bacterium]|jgi:hypothetical protein|nr:hypothetical protein [Lachnospiraceae bacterium]MCI9400409.1 hypothetical protein [Lachnospiraceae bacterium]MCX4376459.1 hypothetical protein [Lachnospiraceae bacterium]